MNNLSIIMAALAVMVSTRQKTATLLHDLWQTWLGFLSEYPEVAAILYFATGYSILHSLLLLCQ